MVHGECEWDAWYLDPRRFTRYANTEHTCLKAVEDYRNEFHYHLPHEYRPAARLARTTPLYPVLNAMHCEWGVVAGWERALFFKPDDDFVNQHSYRFTPAMDIVAREVRGIVEGVGIMEVSGFNRYEIKGHGAGDFLDTMICGAMPKTTGRIRLCYLLTEKGNVLGEATITRLGQDHYWYGSAAATEWHDRDWLNRYKPDSVLAETLAALVMVNIFKPGYPMIFSNWPFVIDLRTGSFAGGGGEITLLNAASAQLSNWLGLPSGVAASMADAKAVDAQMGIEKALSSLATGLAGANMVYESSGMMASLLGVSHAAFVVDDEMLSHVYRIIRGVEVNEETLGFEAIREAVTGEGHFLGGSHTMDAMQKEHYYPKLANRDDPRTWQEGGARDMWQQAHDKASQILASHYPVYIDSATDNKIRSHFNILLDRSVR